MRILKALLCVVLVAGFFIAFFGMRHASGGAVFDLSNTESPFTVAAFINQARKGNLEAVERFLRAGMDINVRNRQGMTALCVAAANGHDDIVSLLAARGANLDLTDRFGNTPVDMAAKCGYAGTVELLLDLGAYEIIDPET
jgi:ankyrin repeat protein